MKTIPVIFILSLAVLVVACGKDKFETKPRLEITNYSSKEIRQGDNLKISINYFDKEGDLNSAPVFAVINRLNANPLPAGQNRVDTLNYSLPDFPQKDKGEVFFQLPFDFLKESLTENDTLQFKFAVTDRAGNNSDTITSDPVVIILP